MKKLLYIFILSLFAFAGTAQVRVIPKPNPPRLVLDQANVLSPEQERLLEDQLVALDNSTSNQIAIVLVKTLDGGAIEDVAVETYRTWGIGTAKKNNGVLILAAIDDRKIRIEVGYGLEGAIPDAVSGSIIRNDITPLFKVGDYYHGLLKAVDNLGKAATGEYKEARQKKGVGGGKSILTMIVILFVILMMIGRGGGRGGRGGNMMSRRGSDWLGPMIIGSMLGGGGRGGDGGGFGGGGFGGGGFGGFGGGSSGGGGASGSW